MSDSNVNEAAPVGQPPDPDTQPHPWLRTERPRFEGEAARAQPASPASGFTAPVFPEGTVVQHGSPAEDQVLAAGGVVNEYGIVSYPGGVIIPQLVQPVVDGSNQEQSVDTVTTDQQDDGLDALTKAELYEEAQTLDVDGRSKMGKQDLIQAIRTARSTQ